MTDTHDAAVPRRGRYDGKTTCRKCDANLHTVLYLPRIGVTWLSKGGCCGPCHATWAKNSPEASS